MVGWNWDNKAKEIKKHLEDCLVIQGGQCIMQKLKAQETPKGRLHSFFFKAQFVITWKPESNLSQRE